MYFLSLLLLLFCLYTSRWNQGVLHRVNKVELKARPAIQRKNEMENGDLPIQNIHATWLDSLLISGWLVIVQMTVLSTIKRIRYFWEIFD